MGIYSEMLVVFDLDDTLALEKDFLLSGFRAVGRHIGLSAGAGIGESVTCEMGRAVEEGRSHYDALEGLLVSNGLEGKFRMSDLVSYCRTHRPDKGYGFIPGAEALLDRIVGEGGTVGILTDGRGSTQRHKIEALGLERWVSDSDIWISGERGADKHHEAPFRHFMDAHPEITTYVYIGDNPAKDFVWPNRLGWHTVMLSDRGENIHPQPLCIDVSLVARWVVDNLDNV